MGEIALWLILSKIMGDVERDERGRKAVERTSGMGRKALARKGEEGIRECVQEREIEKDGEEERKREIREESERKG